MKKFYLASLVCLFALVSYGNNEENYIPGQVVRADGSRMSTLVKIPESAEERTVLIKDAETGEGASIESSDIRSITVIVNGKTVQYIYTNYASSQNKQASTSVWLKTESWGEVLLYSGTWNGRQIYFIKSESDKLPRQVTQSNFKMALIPLISDNTYLTHDLENGKYEYADLITLLDEYNSWKSFE